MARKSCAHLSSKIRGIENPTQGHPCDPMHQNGSGVDCCCLEIRGEGIWMVDFCLQTHPILVVFGRNSGIMSCVGYGKWGQIAPTMNRSIGIGHMQMDLGSISGRIEKGVAESLRIAQNRCRVMRWNFRSCACFSASTMRALQVDVSNKSNTNYVFDAALSRGGVGFWRFWAQLIQNSFFKVSLINDAVIN